VIEAPRAQRALTEKEEGKERDGRERELYLV